MARLEEGKSYLGERVHDREGGWMCEKGRGRAILRDRRRVGGSVPAPQVEDDWEREGGVPLKRKWNCIREDQGLER